MPVKRNDKKRKVELKENGWVPSLPQDYIEDSVRRG